MSATPITSLTPTPIADRASSVSAGATDGAFGRTLAAAMAKDVPAAATTAVEPLLLAHLRHQEAAHRDREARRRGKELLQALSALQHAMLGGGDDAAALTDLARLLSGIPKATDPSLSGIVREIAVRAAVEVARREVFTSSG